MLPAAEKLLTFIERIERLEEERKSLADDIADVYRELAGDGYDKDATKVIVKIRRTDDGLSKWQGASETVDFYLSSLGMLGPVIEDRAPARAREIIEQFDAETGAITSKGKRFKWTKHADGSDSVEVNEYDPETGEITEHEQPETVDETMGGLPVAAASETAEETGRTPAYTRMGRHGTPHGSGVTGGESAATETHERPSTNDKAYLEAVPQDEASLAGTGSRMLAGREGRHEGEAASACLPTHSQSAEVPSAADKPETAVTPLPAVSGAIPEGIPAFLLKERKPLRTNCLHPDNCAGYGSHTCHSCTRAMAESEVAA